MKSDRNGGGRAVSETGAVFVILVTACMLILHDSVLAQWAESNGPDMRYIEAYATMGDAVFAVGRTGVFKSEDEGLTWNVASDDLNGTDVHAIVTGEARMFVVVDGGLFRSTDMGASWEKASDGPYDGRAPGAVFSFREPGGSGMTLCLGYANRGVHFSTDDGGTWLPWNDGLPEDMNITAFGAAGDRIFAASYRHGIFVSTDRGGSWTSTQSGLENEYVRHVSTVGTDLYIATSGSLFSGLYRSTDLGSSWNKVEGPFEGAYLRTISARGDNLYAGTTTMGLFRTSDGGVSWNSADTGIPDDFIYEIGQSDEAMFVASNGIGVFRSTDDGARWSSVTAGLGEYDVQSIFTSASSLFACTEHGLYRSDDTGRSWRGVETGAQSTSIWSSCVVGDLLFLGTVGQGVVRSTDGGKTWQKRNSGLGDSVISALAASASDLYAGTLAAGAFRSTDFGDTWYQIDDGVPTPYVSALYADDAFVLRGAYASIFLSADRGDHWISRSAGLPGTSPKAIARIGDALFSAAWGVYRSLDEGRNWELMTDGVLTNVSSMLVIETFLFAGCGDGSIFMTTDLGETWSYVGHDLPGEVQCLQRLGPYLFAGTRSDGTWKRELSQVIVGSTSAPVLPASVRLLQNYPNPFNPVTTISFELPDHRFVRLTVHDIYGRRLLTVAEGEFAAGVYHVEVDGSELPSGSYVYRLRCNNDVKTRKMLLMK